VSFLARRLSTNAIKPQGPFGCDESNLFSGLPLWNAKGSTRKRWQTASVRVEVAREMLVFWGDFDGNEYDALSLVSDPVVIARSISQTTGAVHLQNKFLKAPVNLVPALDRVDPLSHLDYFRVESGRRA
jgi:hypothetical protein